MLKILLIDDNPDDRLLIIRQLKREFPQIALEQIIDRQNLDRALEQMQFDLAVTDYQLRWTTGLVVLREIKQRDPYRPVVMFTNTGSQEIAVEAMKAGLDDYVVKSPQHFIRLSSAVRTSWERAQNQQKADEREMRLQFLLDRLSVGVFRLDRYGMLLETNPTFLQLLGVNSFQEAQQLDLEKMQVRSPNADPQKKRQVQLERADGSNIWLEISETPIELKGETFIEGLVEDISARVSAQLAMQQLNQLLEERVEERTAQLEEVNQELMAFAYSVSHDLQEPLRGIQGFVLALQEDYGETLSGAGGNYLHRIDNAADRLEKMIKDLLEYSRITRSELKLSPIDLEKVVEEALSSLEAKLRDRQVEVTVDKPLPQVRGHYSTLLKVTINLLANAIKFVKPGKVPQVRVWAEKGDRWVRLWIADNGIGIAAENQQRIFRVFERLHGIESYAGTGIGLAVVRKGVERLGGRFGVESERDRGSKFWIELPPEKTRWERDASAECWHGRHNENSSRTDGCC